jgi:hypothetical protein
VIWVSPTAIRAIQAMVAPVVLITTGAILSGGILNLYGSVNDRMRIMTRERREILTGSTGTLLSKADVNAGGRERLGEIDTQLPLLRRRHHLLRDGVLTIFLSIAVLVLSVIIIGAAVTSDSDAVSIAALCLVLVGTTVLLVGLLLVARSIMVSSDAIDAEVQRTLSLGSRPTVD